MAEVYYKGQTLQRKSEGKGSCRSTSVSLKLVCRVCQHTYTRETFAEFLYSWERTLTCFRRKGRSFGNVEILVREAWRKRSTGMFHDDAMLKQITESAQQG